jgi:hypothetical protein
VDPALPDTGRSATQRADRSERIPLHKGRILAKTISGLLVTIASGIALVLGVLGTLRHYGDVSQQIALTIALLGGLAAMLRGISQLQNGEPGLIVGPRGLTIHAGDVGTLGPIPWSAVSKLETKRHSGRPYVAVQLREPGRFLPDPGLLGQLLGALNRRMSSGAVTISPQWLQIAPKDLDALLQRYFERYRGGNPAAESDAERSRKLAT